MINNIWKKIRNFFSTEKEIEEAPAEEFEETIKKHYKIKKDICNLKTCKEKLNMLNGFKCHYCDNYFCDKHRLPEEHNCKGNVTLPKEMRPGTETESWTFRN